MHMCPGVIYEWAPGRTPQRGPLHAAWLWVLCTIPPVNTGLSHTHTHTYIAHKQGTAKIPLMSSELFRLKLAARLTLQKAR